MEYLGGQRITRREWVVFCPKCGREKLTVNLEKRLWRCFICEHGDYGRGNVFGLIQWVEDFSPYQTAQFILEHGGPQPVGVDLLPDPGFGRPDPYAEPTNLVPCDLPNNCLAVTGTLPYMERRQISAADANAFGLGYCTSGWLANRLVFPVWENGRCVYWQARAMWDESEHIPKPWRRKDGTWDPDKYRKTLNPARERDGVFYFGSGDVLLNLEQASTFPRVAITEGPTSCIRVGPSAVATFGKQLQPRQISRMISAKVQAVDFMWDGPTEKEPQGAWPQMMEAAAMLSPFLDVRMVFLPRGDPGDYSREQLEEYRRQARPFNQVGDFI